MIAMIKVKSDLGGSKARYSKIAILAAMISLCAIVALSIFYFWPSALAMILCLIAAMVGLTCGITGFIFIKRSRRLLKGLFFSTLGIIIPVLLVITVLFVAFQLRGEISNFLCQERLYGLWQCLISYSESSNGKYPLADSWCDLLEEKECPKIYFTCPTEKDSLCSYAMNPNVSPNSPPDIVLVFESTSGWNQFGGSELIDANNHVEEGANVLFNGGYVEFVIPKDFDKLKWQENQK